MPNIEHHTPGTFCWWELATPDLEAAWRFYHTLFRWEKRDASIGDGQVYRICVLEGQDVAAMYQRSLEQLAHPNAAAWLPYVAVKSADNTAKRVSERGALVLQAPFDVLESGRMALCADPEGARFALWEARAHQGAGIIREIGTVAWTELTARDLDQARGFYSALFGWKTETRAMGPIGDYATLRVAGESDDFGGMLRQPPWGANQNPTWWTYFRVADCDETTALVHSARGQVGVGPFEVPGAGRIAIATDPQGAGFAMIETSPGG